MQNRVSEIFTEANDELTKKWDAYMKKAQSKCDNLYDAYQNAMDAGNSKDIEDAKAAYQAALKNITFKDDWYKNMVEETTAQLANVNQTAVAYLNGEIPEIYTRNYNQIASDCEKIAGYSFSLMDQETLKALVTDGKLRLPEKKVNVPLDKAWNKKAISSQLMQGIIQGESIPKIAKRLENVIGMNRKSAIRNARTMTTSAECEGRFNSYKKATSDGIVMKKVWTATEDKRTRPTHKEADGQKADVDKPFTVGGYEMMYPGDSKGRPEEVYNCRCTIVSDIIGFRKADGHIDYLDAKEQDDEPEFSEEYKKLKEELKHIDHLKVSEHTSEITENEIIERLSGGDLTTGSCASLGIAYIGQKCGYDVLDFRGGASREWFSGKLNKLKMWDSMGVSYIIEDSFKSDLSNGRKILSKMESGKQYYLSVGRHAAVVKMSDDETPRPMYLELQSRYGTRKYIGNGWQYFDKDVKETLKDRFGCEPSSTYWNKAYLTDIEQLKGKTEFKDLLGYINTQESNQLKGAGGNAK